MTEPLVCAACERPITSGYPLWYRPFAEAGTDVRIGQNLSSRISCTDNGGTAFHSECLKRLAPIFGWDKEDVGRA